MRYYIPLLLLINITQSVQAYIFRTIHNDTNNKIRISLWYKRYDRVKNQVIYANRTHKITTYIKPNDSVRLKIRAKKHDHAKVFYLIATNTKRRNDWDGLIPQDLQNTDTFTIAYHKHCLRITPDTPSFEYTPDPLLSKIRD